MRNLVTDFLRSELNTTHPTIEFDLTQFLSLQSEVTALVLRSLLCGGLWGVFLQFLCDIASLGCFLLYGNTGEFSNECR